MLFNVIGEPTIKKKTKRPRQDRSIKTYNSLLDAAERLLKLRPWEEISTVNIMLEADCSNGAIYGRFKNKDELLVKLYERHDEKLRARNKRRNQQSETDTKSLEDMLTSEIGHLIKMHRENRWLLRAMGLLSRTKPEVVTPEMRQERKVILDQIVNQFAGYGNLGDQMRRVEIGVFFVSTILRESILYQGPHFGTLDLSDQELKKYLVQMALGFLGSSK